MKYRETLVDECNAFFLYERVMPGKTWYVIFERESATNTLIEVKQMRGGGHTTARLANNELQRLACVAATKRAKELGYLK